MAKRPPTGIERDALQPTRLQTVLEEIDEAFAMAMAQLDEMPGMPPRIYAARATVLMQHAQLRLSVLHVMLLQRSAVVVSKEFVEAVAVLIRRADTTDTPSMIAVEVITRELERGAK